MSSLRKKALVRLLLCALALIATIVFCVLLLTGSPSSPPQCTPRANSPPSRSRRTPP